MKSGWNVVAWGYQCISNHAMLEAVAYGFRPGNRGGGIEKSR